MLGKADKLKGLSVLTEIVIAFWFGPKQANEHPPFISLEHAILRPNLVSLLSSSKLL